MVGFLTIIIVILLILVSLLYSSVRSLQNQFEENKNIINALSEAYSDLYADYEKIMGIIPTGLNPKRN